MSAQAPRVLRPEHLSPCSLSDLAHTFDLTTVGDVEGAAVTGVAVAASHVHPGDLYVGMRGAHAHGASFAVEARQRGAVALLTDAEGLALASGSGLPALVSPYSASPERMARPLPLICSTLCCGTWGVARA